MTFRPLRVEVTTTIRAARETVFDAWLTADRMARVLCAGDTHVASLEVDARVGGAFRIVMANLRGRYDHRGRYLEIERPQRLRFTWASAATNGVTVTFDTIDAGTRVTLVHEGLSDAKAAEQHEGGWQSIVVKCHDELEGAARTRFTCLPSAAGHVRAPST